MKMFILAVVVAVSASVSFAGEGKDCGSCCKAKKADSAEVKQGGDQAKPAPATDAKPAK